MGNWQLAIGNVAAFTIMEIAICLAIIGFALVAIIGVLPYGMNTQRDVREETVINQDATVLLEAIRTSARGADYLTNYVYAITNYWAQYDSSGNQVTPIHTIGYNFTGVYLDDVLQPNLSYFSLTNGANIIGVLSTPEFTDGSIAIPTLTFGGISNHIVAYVRSISGPAAEKPPQDNPILREDTLTYRLLVVNAPMPVDTNLFYLYPPWNGSQNYTTNDLVFFDWTYWLAVANGNGRPGLSSQWLETPLFPLKLALNQRELRLSFFWPLLPTGNVGYGRQTFRTTIAGQLVPVTGLAGQWLYYYVPQTFINTP